MRANRVEREGGIDGTVQDPDGAVVPDVKVTVSNPATGSTRVTNTNASGEFGFSALDPGSYAGKAS